MYVFDQTQYARGTLDVKHSLPYSDLTDLPERELRERLAQGEPIEFGHTLTDLIGGQIEAGFVIAGFYEDVEPGELMARHMPMYIVTRAVKCAGAPASTATL